MESCLTLGGACLLEDEMVGALRRVGLSRFFFFKGIDSKYLRLCGPWSYSRNHSTAP